MCSRRVCGAFIAPPRGLSFGLFLGMGASESTERKSDAPQENPSLKFQPMVNLLLCTEGQPIVTLLSRVDVSDADKVAKALMEARCAAAARPAKHTAWPRPHATRTRRPPTPSPFLRLLDHGFRRAPTTATATTATAATTTTAAAAAAAATSATQSHQHRPRAYFGPHQLRVLTL